MPTMPWVPSKEGVNSWTLCTESDFPGHKLLIASAFFHFLLVEFSLPTYTSGSTTFLSNYYILQVLARHCLVCLLQKSSDSNSQVLPTKSQQTLSQEIRGKGRRRT